ncbi:MAG: DHH family phosphoesterase [Candidatus Berkelbacteria bacterium]|nr:DHH family phosphoesterase [Candidatus Berkelbacteria bacterium]
MELSPKQQIAEAIRGVGNILLLTHKDPDGDAVGSIVAFALALKKLGKNVNAVCADPISNVFSFLPTSEVKNELSGHRDFVISLDVSKTAAEKFLYKIEDGKINFIVTPKSGEFTSDAVTFPAGKFKSDLIIVLDCPDLERLGPIYSENSDLFYETPVVNIDHHAGNDHFGKINFVDLTATSTCEILVSIFETLSKDTSLLTEEIATALLTGIITDTNSFQNANTTPKSLTVAAQLVAAKGDQQEIIQRIYKTRSLSTLRLWGKVLSNIHDERGYRFIWSEIRRNDFLAAHANADDADGVIDELLKTASGVDFVLLISQKNGTLHGSLRSVAKGIDVSAVAKLFAGGGHAMAAGFEVDRTDASLTSEKIISKIRDYQNSIQPQ